MCGCGKSAVKVQHLLAEAQALCGDNSEGVWEAKESARAGKGTGEWGMT